MATALTVTAVVTSGGGAAGAATTFKAQSVGRFLDGSLAGKPVQAIADIKDARAKAPGTSTAQNPLDVTLLDALTLPLTNALKLPGGGVAKLGAANQVAVAKTTGYSYGASGAVSNSGGVSVGGDDNAYPADATIDLSASALGSLPIPGLPGGSDSTAAALGGVSASIGAVSALAKTKSGGGFAAPTYDIADLSLSLGSPALGGLLKQLVAGGKQVTTLLAPIVTALGGALPADCNLTNGTLPSTISLDKGAVTIDASTATITVSLKALLKELGANIDGLPPNTDLLAYVLNELPTILSKGLENVVDDLIAPVKALGDKCLPVLGPVGQLTQVLIDTLTQGQKQLEDAVNTIADTLGSVGKSGLGALTDNLAKLVDIGVNVQQGAYPLSSEPKPKYPFSSALNATPDQATDVVKGQGVVRALEIDLLNVSVPSFTANAESARQLAGVPAARPLAVSAPSSAVALALASAAAGPSTAVAAPTSSTPASPTGTVPPTAVPTGVPAGQASAGHDGGVPTLPLVLALFGLMIAGGGTLALRLRGGHIR